MHGILYTTNVFTGAVEEDNKYFSSHVDLTDGRAAVVEGATIALIGAYGSMTNYKVVAVDDNTAILLRVQGVRRELVHA